MISALPKHKSSEHTLSELRHRLAKLKKEATTQRRAAAKPKFIIRKEGAAQICIIGDTQSGKSTLLNSLTNAKVKVDNHPFTTELPEVGMMFVDDVPIQLVEIPSTFDPDSIGVMRNCDRIIILVDKMKDVHDQKSRMQRLLKENRLTGKKYVFLKNDYTQRGLDKLKKNIWKNLRLIKVYTKEPGKQKAIPPIALKPGSTVHDVASQIHKDFLKDFKFARVFNNSRFSGRKVGLDYRVQDNDVIEIHAR